VRCRDAGADGDRAADHRNQGNRTGQQPVRKDRCDQLLEVAIQRLPMGLALLLRDLAGVAQVEQSKAAPVGSLLEAGGDRGQQEH
jgi:hypothetical protein